MELKQHPQAIWHILVRLILLCTFSVTQINQAAFADSPTNRQTLLQAAEITYSKENDVITALGNVELSQGSRILLADKVIYRQKKDEVTAEGNVILLEPNGEVLFSTKVVLSDKLKSGLIKDFKLLMNDGSRFAANSAIRSDGNRNVMKEAIFSPCHPCKENPNKPLVWQIKANQITHYEATKDLEYEGALLEIFDLPIFYMPYFIHPDPSVERRSGFLIPTVGHSDEKGFIYGQPYFQVIDEARDIKLEPSIYTRKGIILKTHYRHALERGNIDLKTTTGVIANDLNETGFNDVALKGSIDLEAKFAIDDTW
ncbi:MAG: LptA/OstA family protein, partial [Pseudomonadota bacterium]|nr:LptA/OstA family protein [Pseudomonadota bacterium]